MTLLEQIVAITVAIVLSAGALAVAVAAYRAGELGSSLTEAAAAARIIGSAIARDARSASSAPECSPGTLRLSGSRGEVSYEYISDTRTLLRNGKPYPYRVVRISWACSGRLVSGSVAVETRRGLTVGRSEATFTSLMRVSR